MAYKYKNLKTNKIVIKAEPIKGAKKREYQLMSWNHTAIIKNNDKNENQIIMAIKAPIDP